MSTQYDQIGALYNDMKALPAARLERANVKEAVEPYVKGASVLDLACGTGYYSQALLEWGASKVVGVDISPVMVEGAKKAALVKGQENRSTFLVGDCSKPMSFEGGPFDLVLACWLLNYASDGEEMTNMFRNVATNLKPGGVFIGVAQPPSKDIKKQAASGDGEMWRQYGVTMLYTEEIKEGYKTRVIGHTSPKTVEFDNFYLRKDVYETSARRAGLKGVLSWKTITLPDNHEEVLGRFEPNYWDQVLESPHFGVVILSG